MKLHIVEAQQNAIQQLLQHCKAEQKSHGIIIILHMQS